MLREKHLPQDSWAQRQEVYKSNKARAPLSTEFGDAICNYCDTPTYKAPLGNGKPAQNNWIHLSRPLPNQFFAPNPPKLLYQVSFQFRTELQRVSTLPQTPHPGPAPRERGANVYLAVLAARGQLLAIGRPGDAEHPVPVTWQREHEQA